MELSNRDLFVEGIKMANARYVNFQLVKKR
jgi:hypothetical protein